MSHAQFDYDRLDSGYGRSTVPQSILLEDAGDRHLELHLGEACADAVAWPATERQPRHRVVRRVESARGYGKSEAPKLDFQWLGVVVFHQLRNSQVDTRRLIVRGYSSEKKNQPLGLECVGLGPDGGITVDVPHRHAHHRALLQLHRAYGSRVDARAVDEAVRKVG